MIPASSFLVLELGLHNYLTYVCLYYPRFGNDLNKDTIPKGTVLIDR